MERNVIEDRTPVGQGDPRIDRSAVIDLLTDYLLNTVQQADEVSQDLVMAFARQAVDNAVVFAKKQHDYGPGNIASFGEMGVLVRLSDKVARLRNLQGRAAKNEAVGDSWLDVANYGVIAQIVREGLWPGCEARHALTPETLAEPPQQDGTATDRDFEDEMAERAASVVPEDEGEASDD